MCICDGAMIIGVPKEIKPGEHRVALLPNHVEKLRAEKHTVLIEKDAGIGSGFDDAAYKTAGAEIVSRKDVWSKTELVVKVKEPIAKEYSLLKLLKGKLLFAYLHLSGVEKKLTEVLLANRITALAYETIENELGKRALLAPMSAIAGRAAIQYAAEHLQKKHGGAGVMLGGGLGNEPCRVVIFGGGIAGEYAARTALGMGARVTIFEKRPERLKEIRGVCEQEFGFFSKTIQRLALFESGNDEATLKHVAGAHVLVGAVLRPGARPECVVSKELILKTTPGAVIVDIAIDQGGCMWGAKPTTHDKPSYEKEGRIYCCIANIPGQFSFAASLALSRATFPYIEKIADRGLVRSLQDDIGFLQGLQTWNGKLLSKAVATDLKMEEHFMPPEEATAEAIRRAWDI